MGTTSKMGIPYPVATDYVTDGATDMQAIADQVDLKSGLVKIIPTGATNGTVGANGDVTIGTTVSSVTVTGAFNADFENYRIIVSGGTSSASSQEVRLQFGPSSVAGYNSDYDTGFFYTSFTGSGLTTGNTAAQARFRNLSFTFGANGVYVDLNIGQPYLAKWSHLNCSSPGTTNTHWANGVHRQSQSYTDFELSCDFGTLTGGKIRIYGYN